MNTTTNTASSRNTLACLGGAAVAAALFTLAPWPLIGQAISKPFLLIGNALGAWQSLVGSVAENSTSFVWGIFLFGMFFLACKAHKGSLRALSSLFLWLATWGLLVGFPSMINEIAYEHSIGKNASFVAWLKDDQNRAGNFGKVWDAEIMNNGMVSRAGSKKLCQVRTQASLANAEHYTLTINGKPATSPEQCRLVNDMTWTSRARD